MRDLPRWLLVVAVGVHLVVLYWPFPPSGGGVPGLDKLAHVAVFAAVAVTGRLAGVPVRRLALVLVGHAVLSEVVQHTVLPNRSGNPADVVADLVGVAVGLLVPLPEWARRGRDRVDVGSS